MEDENIIEKNILGELKRIEQQFDVNNRIIRLLSFLTLYILFVLVGIIMAITYFIQNYSQWWRFS